MSELRIHLNELRRAANLSQAALADQIGISRQAMSAIEAGRQTPSTQIALLLARALRCTVEDLFELPSHQELVALIDGVNKRMTLGQVDGHWVGHGVAAETDADAVLIRSRSQDAVVAPLKAPSDLEQTIFIAGCAPVLGIFAQNASAYGLRARWRQANSEDSLSLLQRGLVHIAGVHFHDAFGVIARRFKEPMTTIHLTRWVEGLVVPKGNPSGISLDSLRTNMRLASREAGSASQNVWLQFLGDRPAPSGPIVPSHDAVAQLVRYGVVDAGVGIEPAARSADLGFVPLAEERFNLVLPTRRLGQPCISRLLGHLNDRRFVAQIRHLDGYDFSDIGAMVSA